METPEERRVRIRRLAKERYEARQRDLRDSKNIDTARILDWHDQLQEPLAEELEPDMTIEKGPRGGRYTRAISKDGRPYRRYF